MPMNAMWIKICGMTTSEAVEAAIEARVDAIGFVFAESKRRVTPERAAQLAAPARGKVKCVAVTKQPEQRDIREILDVFRPDILQSDAEDLSRLELPAALTLLPVLRAGAAEPKSLPRRFLFEGPVSGIGTTADWAQAEILARCADLILAGGLTPDNVATAIAEVQPFGVDVSSGVESAPGLKSPEKIARFVRSARAASPQREPPARAKENAS
jgi:phosphoribosylanthranilate isomerase